MSTVNMDVISVKPAPSGKSLIVQVAGRKEGYFAKLDSGIQGGMSIAAETKASEYNGKTNWWIEKWQRTSATPAPTPGAAAESRERFSAEGVNLNFLPFTSNVVAHAIAAGYVKQPSDIFLWAQEAYKTASRLGAKDDEEEGDIPF